jgi:hypothetical protein
LRRPPGLDWRSFGDSTGDQKLLDQHAVQKLLDQHDVQTSIVDANLQILSRGIHAPWDTRRHISNHAHDAAMADASGRT